MDNYVTGAAIKRLREKKKLTQSELADKIGVTAKAVSKWETARGLPDISLIEPLAAALGVSVAELMSGEAVINANVSANMLRSRLYVCPVCGNAVRTVGEAVVSCCGVNLPALEAEEADDGHEIKIKRIEHEYYVSIDHEMTKNHYISFVAYVTSDRFELVKLYPEGNAETRFAIRDHGFIYIYCNRHGLMKKRI